MMLAKFFGYTLSLSKTTYQQKSLRISQAFFVIACIYISLTYKCENVNNFSAVPMLCRYV